MAVTYLGGCVVTVSLLPLQLPVRSIFGQVIIAMAHHDYLSLEGGHQMIEFMVKQCAIYTEDKVCSLLLLFVCWFVCWFVLEQHSFPTFSPPSLPPSLQALAKLSGNGVTPVSLRDMSNSVLLLITTTIKHMEDVSWGRN